MPFDDLFKNLPRVGVAAPVPEVKKLVKAHGLSSVWRSNKNKVIEGAEGKTFLIIKEQHYELVPGIIQDQETLIFLNNISPFLYLAIDATNLEIPLNDEKTQIQITEDVSKKISTLYKEELVKLNSLNNPFSGKVFTKISEIDLVELEFYLAFQPAITLTVNLQSQTVPMVVKVDPQVGTVLPDLSPLLFMFEVKEKHKISVNWYQLALGRTDIVWLVETLTKGIDYDHSFNPENKTHTLIIRTQFLNKLHFNNYHYKKSVAEKKITVVLNQVYGGREQGENQRDGQLNLNNGLSQEMLTQVNHPVYARGIVNLKKATSTEEEQILKFCEFKLLSDISENVCREDSVSGLKFKQLLATELRCSLDQVRFITKFKTESGTARIFNANNTGFKLESNAEDQDLVSVDVVNLEDYPPVTEEATPSVNLSDYIFAISIISTQMGLALPRYDLVVYKRSDWENSPGYVDPTIIQPVTEDLPSYIESDCDGTYMGAYVTNWKVIVADLEALGLIYHNGLALYLQQVNRWEVFLK